MTTSRGSLHTAGKAAQASGPNSTTSEIPDASVRVTTALESAARDSATINAGTASFELMWAAGTAATHVILARWSELLSDGVAIYAGSGNNGGDAYVVAALLVRAGISVRLRATAPPRTPDAIRASIVAGALIEAGAPTGKEHLVIDGILGTGQRGELRGAVRDMCVEINTSATRGAFVVALDLPTGVDATSGHVADHAVRAHATLTFGTVKRAHVIARDIVGDVVLLDIGLLPPASDDQSWWLADAHSLSALVPAIAWNAHKGSRGKLALVGGVTGMAGAITLAARAALASGIGLTHAWVAQESVVPVQIGVPQAIAHAWPLDDTTWNAVAATAIAIGPGLGRSELSRRTLHAVLNPASTCPILLDADALTLFGDNSVRHAGTTPDFSAAQRISHALNGRPAVLTPHPGEFAHLLTLSSAEQLGDLATRADLASTFAKLSGATVLLKGTPTIVASPHDQRVAVAARGNAVLGTGGGGDTLTGIVATLLAQNASPRNAAIIGAWVHGIAAEIAVQEFGAIRGVTLDHVLGALPHAWRQLQSPTVRDPQVLTELPSPVTVV